MAYDRNRGQDLETTREALASWRRLHGGRGRPIPAELWSRAADGRAGRLSLDHLVPKARGGGDESDNVVWACGSCNSSKGALDLLAWLATRGTFPPRLLLRRYLKLALAWAERERLLDRAVAELHEAPFALEHVPVVYPSPAGLQLWVTARSSAGAPPSSRAPPPTSRCTT